MCHFTQQQSKIKTIPLTRGKYAIVDAADYEWLSQWKWHANPSGRTWYARRAVKQDDGRYRGIKMHRIILGAKDGESVDHIDGDGLNNTRSNLRFACHNQNWWNVRLRIDSTSGYKGVTWYRKLNKWRARIQIDTKRVHLGYHENIEDAARAYDKAARKAYGEFARLNFPEEESIRK